MNFKRITKDNLKVAAKIYMECFNAAPWFEKWTMETSLKRISQIVKEDNHFGLLTYLKEEPCAIIVGHEEDYYDGTRCFIKELCVDSTLQGKGIGSKTLDYYIEELKRKDINHVSLQTLRNPKTLGFYEKAGFKEREHLIMLELA
ncbi:GNAT family N-acetyltransferase [uncultured Clostridium sp.]|uniref:GNAT family N-acetyltransferase n=1 Tax=uncultured Clostridium sp. TaxID=59620 RepID=UPI00261C87C7|nr:GNAT family N-acetyltransferase [uncultured Clostridium sp.]